MYGNNSMQRVSVSNGSYKRQKEIDDTSLNNSVSMRLRTLSIHNCTISVSGRVSTRCQKTEAHPIRKVGGVLVPISKGKNEKKKIGKV